MIATEEQVLFVDDVADTRYLVEWNLRQEGLSVTSVETADECLGKAREHKYALILLDIGLPDRDGLELCREIRKFDHETPILLYTAYADLLDHEEARRAGAQGCLRKPEDTARLGQVVRSVISKTRAGGPAH